MATKKIRVYELAREIGVENAVVLELAEELKVGVKSHSSSIDEPSADRIRRLADSKGLKKAPEPEPEPEVKEEAAPRAVVRAGGSRPATTSTAITSTPPPPPGPPVSSTPAPPAAPAVPAEPPAAVAPPADDAPSNGHGDGGEGRSVVRSTGTVPLDPQGPRPAPPRPATPPPARAPERPAASAPDIGAPTAPRSATGKPIPPPPGVRSPSGKAVPPPPGRRTPPPPPGQRAPGGAGRSGPGGGFSRPSGGGGAGAGAGAPGGYRSGPGGGAPGGGPGGFNRSGPGGGPGGPGGGRGGPGGGPGGRGRPGGPRRRKKRRRQLEELEPERINYTPSDTPIPEGEIVVPRGITIQELAPKLNRTAADLVRLMFDAGEMVMATQSLPDEMIELIAEALGAEVLLVEPGHEEEVGLIALLEEDDEDEDEDLLEFRAPVVTVMGHVDHGKTTLLDYLRSANVVAGEAGGITQHIGAYQVVKDGHPITFIDTPGHAAFTAMRKRGADATDIAILVVAADDGVMPQTVEAIAHARAAEVPIIVAITKVDREDADPQRVRQQLTENELIPEEWGGDTVINEVAAPTGQGVDELLASILLVAELEDLKANPNAPARGFVLEADLDKGRGPVATVLVERGTLRVGDPFVAGGSWGKIRALVNDQGKQVKEAGPSVPVEVLGLDGVPLAGDELRVAPNDKVARTVAEARARRRRAGDLAHPMALSGGTKLEDIFAMVQRGETATLNLVLKADVQGSLEALTDSLRRLDQSHEEVRLSFVRRAVGGITEDDINLAAVANATVIGFNVRPDRRARDMAAKEGVELRLYEIIYKAIEDVEAALVGMLKPEFEEVVTGEAEVREVFGVPRVGKVAGCFVRSGVITRGSQVRFLRDGTIIWKGSIATLRRFKEDVREVRDGFECGIGLENFQDLRPGDLIETFEVREMARTS